MIRRWNGNEERREFLYVDPDWTTENSVAIQSVKGLWTVFVNGRCAIETSEHDLLEGTLAFEPHQEMPGLPIERVVIEKRTMIVDNFAAVASGRPAACWRIIDGSWRVATILRSEGSGDDAQLSIRGAGTALIDRRPLRRSLLQVSAWIGASSDFALVAGWNRESAIELHYRN